MLVDCKGDRVQEGRQSSGDEGLPSHWLVGQTLSVDGTEVVRWWGGGGQVVGQRLSVGDCQVMGL